MICQLPILKFITAQNEQLANKIGKLIILAYNGLYLKWQLLHSLGPPQSPLDRHWYAGIFCSGVAACTASVVQACRDRPPVSPESSTDVPHRLLCSSVRCRRSPAPAIRQPPSTDCSTCPLQHLRLPFLRFCWSVVMVSV